MTDEIKWTNKKVYTVTSNNVVNPINVNTKQNVIWIKQREIDKVTKKMMRREFGTRKR